MMYSWLSRVIPRSRQKDNPATRLHVVPGTVVALPAGRALHVHVVAGTAYITHTGRDIFLWRGDSERLHAMPKRIWGAPLLSALGTEPVTISFCNAEER